MRLNKYQNADLSVLLEPELWSRDAEPSWLVALLLVSKRRTVGACGSWSKIEEGNSYNNDMENCDQHKHMTAFSGTHFACLQEIKTDDAQFDMFLHCVGAGHPRIMALPQGLGKIASGLRKQQMS